MANEAQAQREGIRALVLGVALICVAIAIGYIAQHAADKSDECVFLGLCDIGTGIYALIVILMVIGGGFCLYAVTKMSSGRSGIRVEVFNRQTPTPKTQDVVSPSSAPRHETTDALEELADLHHRGLITAEEYQRKKADILGRL